MRGVIIIMAGAIMVLSSAAHSFLGWPAMRSELAKVGAGESLVGALAAGWFFGSVSMLAFGAIVIASGLRFRRGDRPGSLPAGVIAACYVLFGVGAFLARGFQPHFLLFTLTGLLAGVPLLGLKRP